MDHNLEKCSFAREHCHMSPAHKGSHGNEQTEMHLSMLPCYYTASWHHVGEQVSMFLNTVVDVN